MNRIDDPLTLLGGWKQLFDIWDDALLLVDSEGTICAANPKAEREFGYSKAELQGQPIEVLIPQRFRLSHVQHRSAYAGQPRPRPMGANLSLWALRKDGSEFPVEISLNPIHTVHGVLVCADIRDITEVKRSETLHQRANQADAAARFGQFAITATDLSELKNRACALMRKVFGVDYTLIVEPLGPDRPFLYTAGSGWPDDVIGKQLAPGHSNSLSAFTLQVDEPVLFDDLRQETRFEAPILRSFGVISGIACLIRGREAPLGAIGVHSKTQRTFSHEDASFVRTIANTLGAAIEHQRIQERLNRSQKLEALGQLTGGVAHDFNNLLTVISGNLQLLHERLGGDPFLAKVVSNAERAAGRGADLTRKLLAFAQRQTLQPRAIDLATVVPTVTEMLRQTLGTRVEVITLVAPDTPAVMADPSSLETAIMNLALNARDAMPNGGQITIEVRLERLDESYTSRERDLRPGDYVLLAVSDTGSGMAPEVLAHVFEPFFTTKGKGKGTGLGLAMVYGFVKQSGGHVRVYSEVGRGTSVKLYLPLADASARQATLGRWREMPRGHETVLVVEDDEEVRELAVQFLTSLGYAVLEAPDATEAFATLEKTPSVEVLFTDVILGSGDTGIDLARRAQQLRPNLRVLFTSGYARGALPTQGEFVDSMDLLNKPYRREQLAEKLRSVLDRPPSAGHG